MKTAFNLVEMATEVQRQQEAKKDYKAGTDRLQANGNGLVEIDSIGNFELTNNAHSQVAARLNIPKKYYDKMVVDAPELWATNVNHWFKSNPETRMVRTLDGKIRAFLSDRYRVLDNLELMEHILPVLSERDDLSIESMNINENKLHIKAFFKSLEKEVTSSTQKNDLIRAGICITNSEVGGGALTVSPMTYRLWCLNGAYSDTSRRKYHVEGRKGDANDQVQAILTDETKQVKDKAFWMETRDLVKSCMTLDFLDNEVAKYEGATAKKIEGQIVEVVNRAANHFAINETQKNGVLEHLIAGGDLTQYGLFNAFTRTSQDIEDYETADRFEQIGGQIVTLNDRDWKTISTAVA